MKKVAVIGLGYVGLPLTMQSGISGITNSATIAAFNLVEISPAHASVNFHELAQGAPAIDDTRNAMASIPPAARAKIWKA